MLGTIPRPGDPRSFVGDAVSDLLIRLAPRIEDAFDCAALGHPDPLVDVAMRHGVDHIEIALMKLADGVRAGATEAVRSWSGAARRIDAILTGSKQEARPT